MRILKFTRPGFTSPIYIDADQIAAIGDGWDDKDNTTTLWTKGGREFSLAGNPRDIAKMVWGEAVPDGKEANQ
jgi:hypothetical protein